MTILISVNNPQSNALEECINQVIYNMIVTKDITSKVYDYIETWWETLVSEAWEIRASYHHTLGSTPGQDVFGRDILLNLTSMIDWCVVTARKQRQVNIDNVRKYSRQVRHGYAIGDIVYVENTGIYLKLDYDKKVPY